ncbi:MAG: terpene synthase family protein [Myxococcota bacterium]
MRSPQACCEVAPDTVSKPRNIEESTHRDRGGFPSVEAYIRGRLRFSAVELCLELGYLFRGIPLDGRPVRYAEMARWCNLHISYANDAFSFMKERSRGEVSNLAIVFEQLEGLSPEAALEKTCRYTDQALAMYLSYRPAQEWAGCALMESWMRGNVDWHARRTGRYVEGLSFAASA